MKQNKDQIAINSDEIMDAIEILDESLHIIESEMIPKLDSKFKVLESLDFFSSGLVKLKEQLSSLENSNKNLMSKITLHADEVTTMEAELAQMLARGDVSGTEASGGGRGSYIASSSFQVEQVEENVLLSTHDVEVKVENLDRDALLSVYTFLSINRGKYSLSELLVNVSYSGIVTGLLKRFFSGDSIEEVLEDNSSSTFEIQKKLLEKILTSDSPEILELLQKEDSILIAKEYFVSIAKEREISVGDLLLNEKYEDLLLELIQKLYNGDSTIKYSVSEETVSSIRSYIERLALEKEVSVSTLLSSKEQLNFLKGGVLREN